MSTPTITVLHTHSKEEEKEKREKREIQVFRLTSDVERVIREREARSAKAGSLPLIYDYSMMSTAQSCARKALQAYILHLVPHRRELPFSAGSALHKGLEVNFKGFTSPEKRGRVLGLRKALLSRDFDQVDKGKIKTELENIKTEIRDEALEAFIEEASSDPGLPVKIAQEGKWQPRSIERLFNLLSRYLEECGDPYDNPIWTVERQEDVEVGFAILIPDPTGVTGLSGTGLDGVIIVGRVDLIVRFKKTRKKGIIDHKSTTRMTSTYADQWDLNNQFTTYMVGVEELSGEKVRDGMINVLYFNKNIEEVGLYLPISRTEADIEEWKREVPVVIGQINRMYKRWQNESGGDVSLANQAICNWPKNTTQCTGRQYNTLCRYFDLCSAGWPGVREMIRRADFVEKQWLPFEELGKRGVGVS
jgi:hypothetical protein